MTSTLETVDKRLGPFPEGVRLTDLVTHGDRRGGFTEIFRSSWETGVEPIQWNAVSSAAGVLRGVHVHRKHADYLVVVSGHASIGLQDLRTGSPTFGLGTVVDLEASMMRGISIPPGVAHGFYFHCPSVHVYSVSEYWDPVDELGCHWSDPALAIPWPAVPTNVSARDEALPSLQTLMAELWSV